MATKKTATKAAKTRTRIDGVLVAHDDAKTDVTIKRQMVDIWKGRPGEAGKCMNAVCITRNKKLFPHPVLGVSVVKSRVFILDKPDHAIRYVLSAHDAELIEKHDTIAVGEPGTLVLRAPHGPKKSGAIHGNTPGRGGPHRVGGKYDKPLARGEQARVMAAVGAGTR